MPALGLYTQWNVGGRPYCFTFVTCHDHVLLVCWSTVAGENPTLTPGSFSTVDYDSDTRTVNIYWQVRKFCHFLLFCWFISSRFSCWSADDVYHRTMSVFQYFQSYVAEKFKLNFSYFYRNFFYISTTPSGCKFTGMWITLEGCYVVVRHQE